MLLKHVNGEARTSDVDGLKRRFDAILTESLDRLSRDQEGITCERTELIPPVEIFFREDRPSVE